MKISCQKKFLSAIRLTTIIFISLAFLESLSVTANAKTNTLSKDSITARIKKTKKKKKQKKKNKNTLAEWTVLTYIQADNNLASYAHYNINDMQRAGSTDKVNILIQWDQPYNRKTWRYKITKGGKVEDESLSQEMGIKPVKELVDAMEWAQRKYPAKHYMLVLWNHGNGVLDRSRNLSSFALNPWLEIPGYPNQKERGILYDDSDDTFVSNRDLSNAFSQIKSLLGKKIDIVGMDACLMAMTEVGYQIRNYADYLVGSEHLEPGNGWDYSGFLKPLVNNPELFGAEELAASVVLSYANYYKDRYSSYTQSSIKLSNLNTLTQKINAIISRVEDCYNVKRKRTYNLVKRAHNKSIKFFTKSYLDLYSFLKNLRKKARQYRRRKKEKNNRYKYSLAQLEIAIVNGMKEVKNTISSNAVGSRYKNAKGISIYYPKRYINSSYLKTAFAQNTLWLSFIKKYKINK